MTLGFVFLYHIALLAMTFITMAEMLLVWGASTSSQYLKAVSDSEREGPGKVSDSEMPDLTRFCSFASPPPISPENTPDYTPCGEGNGTPLQYSCLENPMEGGAWKAAVHGVAEGRTLLSDFTFTFYFPALEKEMATHSSVLAWRIPGTGEPGGLPSLGSHRVGHD